MQKSIASPKQLQSEHQSGLTQGEARVGSADQQHHATLVTDSRVATQDKMNLQSAIANSPRATQLQSMKSFIQAGTRATLPSAVHPVQLRLKQWKPSKSPATDKEKLGEINAKKVSDEVDKAYQETESNDLSGAGDAYAALYLLRLSEYGNKKPGKKGMHPSTAAGYVIESKVSNRLAGTDGMNFQNTSLLSGTRPDVTVDLGDGKTALIDMTAQKSLGHIFNKKGNWVGHKSIPYVAEAWYPSMNFSGKAQQLSPQQIKMAEEAAERKKELADLMRAETKQQKTDEFLGVQNELFNKLVSAGGVALKMLFRKKRDMAVLRELGVDLEDDGEQAIKLSIAARNQFAGKTGSDSNPTPGFSVTQKDKGLNIIRNAVRMAEMSGEVRKKTSRTTRTTKRGSKAKSTYKRR